MAIRTAVDCKSYSRHAKALSLDKFPMDKNLKQQWLIKIKRRNIQLIQHVRMCHAYCFG